MAEMAMVRGLAALAVAVILAVLDARPAQAQALTGERLYQLCGDRSTDGWHHVGQYLCPAYIRGIIDGARAQALYVTGSVQTYQSVMPFCEPTGTTAEAAIVVVVQFIDARPESRPQPAAAVVYAALSEKWPCKPGGPR